MITVLLQLPNGQAIPLQVPASTAIEQPSVVQQPIKTSPQMQQPQGIPILMSNGNVTQVVQNIPMILSPTVSSGFMVNKSPVEIISQPQMAAVQTVLTPAVSQAAGVRTLLLPNQQSFVVTDSNSVKVTNNSVLRDALTNPVSSAKNAVGASVSGSQSYTKQRLKAALQQQDRPTKLPQVSQAFILQPELIKTEAVSSSSGIPSPDEHMQHGSSGYG